MDSRSRETGGLDLDSAILGPSGPGLRASPVQHAIILDSSEFHNTVSAIRTIELLLGVEPMNVLDAAAVPIDIFHNEPDLAPYRAILPTITDDNRMNPDRRTADARTRYWMDRTAEQNLVHADMADPEVLNQILWFSVRGDGEEMPRVASLPAFSAMRYGLAQEAEEENELDPVRDVRLFLARQTIEDDEDEARTGRR